jgi:hypothetical protein
MGDKMIENQIVTYSSRNEIMGDKMIENPQKQES